jgi:hypothetical protein
VEWTIGTIVIVVALASTPLGEIVNDDLTGPLDRWPFEPDRLVARMIELEGDRQLLQIRVELGMLQMELTGRPDGPSVPSREDRAEGTRLQD